LTRVGAVPSNGLAPNAGRAMSNRLSFALVVPLVAAVLAGLVVFNVVGLGFAGESCRGHDGLALRWAAAAEAALLQVLFGVVFGLALALLSVVLRRRFVETGQPRLRTGFETAAIIGWLLMLACAVLQGLACTMSPYATLATLALWSGLGLLLLSLGLLIVLFLRGLALPSQ
jgi:hypothetical protein